MNKQQAISEGYTFHGAYSSRDKESIKQTAKDLRKLGNKAIVVFEPANKLSRGCGSGGWSVYWIESEDSKELKKIDTHRKKEKSIIG